jgi:LmbE family N-acetylglucosaminyl deacetylase
MNFGTVLVLSPHTDDGEISCGGTIARFIEEGKSVYYVAFSMAEKSAGDQFPPNVLETEIRKATQSLGIPSDHLVIYEYPVREFPAYRQEILQDIINLREEIQPDLILVPSPNDIHQDHQVICQEGLRAFKRHTIIGYEQPWNNIIFETRLFIPLKHRHVEKKIAALRYYESQNYRSYLDSDFIRSLARTRGTQIESQYAEAFEVLRWVIA